MRIRARGVLISLVLVGAVESSAFSAEYACEKYVDDVKAVIKPDSVTTQFVLDAAAFKTKAGYHAVCFTNTVPMFSLNGKQLRIHNNLGAPIFIDGLFVQQNKALTGCDGTAMCPSIKLTGDFPIILRNTRIEWVGPASTPDKPTTTDGIAIQSDHVTIEVTPEKVTDPAYVTVANFRAGIVVEQRTGVVLDGVKIQRAAAQVGSLGLRVAGPGNTVTNVSTTCTETGIHALGGTAAAPIQISGGTISAGGCATDAGALLQGDHVFLTDTAITGPRVGVILDPLTGPMGIKSGSITKAQIGIEVRNASAATLLALALQPGSFTDVKQLYDFTTATASTPPPIEWSKTCVNTLTQTLEGMQQEVCDMNATDNVVTKIYGTLNAEACSAPKTGELTLYRVEESDGKEKFVFFSACAMDADCVFACTQSQTQESLAIPLAKDIVPILFTIAGGSVLEKIIVSDILDKRTALGPLAVMPSPVDIPNVTPGGGSNDGGLDALTGAGGTDLDASDGGTVLGGGGSDGDALQTLDSNTGPLAHEPLDPAADQPAFEETIAQKEGGTSTPSVLSGSFGGDGDGGGGGMAAPGMGGCSMILQE